MSKCHFPALTLKYTSDFLSKMNHVFVLYPIPEAKDAERKIIDIIKH